MPAVDQWLSSTGCQPPKHERDDAEGRGAGGRQDGRQEDTKHKEIDQEHKHNE